MNKVVTINLNGRAYQVEEAGFADLKRYLGQAAEHLADDPDRDEIIADFEQAVAEKCDQVLVGGKTVVNEKEVAQIIAEMGPVGEPEDKTQSMRKTAHKAGTDRRFYIIKEGSLIGGVATGLSAFFNLDVTVIRLAMVVLAFLTNGFAILAYIVAMIVAPVANTPEKRAKARGTQFNSQDLIEAARRKYSELSQGDAPAFAQVGEVIRTTLRVMAGIVAGIGLLAVMAGAVVALTFLWSFLMNGGSWSATVTGGAPMWQAALFIGCALIVVLIPVFGLSLAAYQYAKHGKSKPSTWGVVMGTVVFAAALSALIALPSNSPELRTSIHAFVKDGESDFHPSDPLQPTCIGICR